MYLTNPTATFVLCTCMIAFLQSTLDYLFLRYFMCTNLAKLYFGQKDIIQSSKAVLGYPQIYNLTDGETLNFLKKTAPKNVFTATL